MPELPEITNLARQMRAELVGKTISAIQVLQSKSLNVPEKDFVAALVGAEVRDVSARGKWIFVETTRGWLLLCLGMGGEILLVTRDTLPQKCRLIFDFTDGTCLSVNFWWFGYAHWTKDLAQHAMTARLGPSALGLGADDLRRMLSGRRGNLKSFLMDQSKMAGIGNVYVQDILFRARLHPLRAINTLSDEEIDALACAIGESLQTAVDLGGSAWEMDLYGQKGRYDENCLLVGYREGQPCPVCGTAIEKVRTGSTSNFICPRCQPLE